MSDLSGPWQLFVDDHVIAEKSGVKRTYHPFRKYEGNPILVADKPWEGRNVYVYGTVLPAEGGRGYRMWYHALPGDEDKYRLLYATSEDGIHWVKPELGIVEYHGSKANNIFIRRSGIDHIASVIHTPWDPTRPYKMVNFDGGPPAGFYGGHSNDGIHWTDVSGNPLLSPGSDVGNFIWDPHTKRYVGYVKLNAWVKNLKRRAVGFSATSDFESWPQAELILAPDEYDDRWVPPGTVQRTHFYGLGAFAYESMYLGLLWIFRATDDEGYFVGPVFVELVSSRDGIHWLRQEGGRSPILELDPEGSWDDSMVYTTQHPLVEGESIKLYYGGMDAVHGTPASQTRSSIGLATLRKDGFASLDAGGAVGIVTTRRLKGARGPLRVNCNADGGWLKAEILDRNGNVLPGYSRDDCRPIQSDAIHHRVTWRDHSEIAPEERLISIRFVLQNASVYSFMAGEAVAVEGAEHHEPEK